MLGRDRDEDVQKLLEAHGYEVHWVEGVDPLPMHQAFAATLDTCYARIRAIQTEARRGSFEAPPRPAAEAVAIAEEVIAEGLERRPGRSSCCAASRGGPGRRSSTACRWRERSAPTRCRSPT